MAGTKFLVEIEPIFREATAELPAGAAAAASIASSSFMLYARGLDYSRLEIVVSDFRSLTFARVLTVPELEDLRDDTGIGGSRDEFVNYLVESLSIGDVELILDGQENFQSDSNGSQAEGMTSHAKLIARKSKGLPRISVSLRRLGSLAAKDATANFSLRLFEAYKNKHIDVTKGQQHLTKLKEELSSERERNNNLQKQLDALTFSSKRKASKSKVSDHVSGSFGSKDMLVSAEEQTAANTSNVDKPPSRDAQSMKGSHRPVPAHRRAKFRGVSLQDNEDNNGN